MLYQIYIKKILDFINNILHSEPLFRNPQPFPGNDDPLDLSCPLINLVNLGVPHQLLHRVLGVESISSENLDSIRCTLKID